MISDYDEYRQRMIDEVSAFITWGLANPDKVRRIPRRRVGEGGWSRAMQRVFWHSVLGTVEIAPRPLLARFLRWANYG
jgi:hypothetical protein